MRTISGLIMAGVLLGYGLGYVAVAFKLFANARKSRTFGFLGFMFVSQALFLLLILAASEDLPKPRPIGYRYYTLAALIVLAIGSWPAIIHLLGLIGDESWPVRLSRFFVFSLKNLWRRKDGQP